MQAVQRDFSQLKNVGKQRDGNGQVLRPVAHCNIERQRNQAHHKAESAEQERDQRLMCSCVAGLEWRLEAGGQKDAARLQRADRSGPSPPGLVERNPKGNHQVAALRCHLVRNGKCNHVRRFLIGGSHISNGADLNPVYKDLASALDVLSLDHQKVRGRAHLHMNAIPDKPGTANAILVQRIVDGYRLPIAIVVRRRCKSGIVAGGEEP